MGFSCFVSTSMALCLTLFFFTTSSYGELQRLEHSLITNTALNFLVIGDWGRRGSYNQSQVALQMGIIGEKLDIDFVVSTGDNFYDNGLTGVEDLAFEESFTKIYTAKSLQKPWYSVLGNHDYRGDVEAQLSPVLRKIDSRWICLRSFIVNAEFVDIFFVDTTPFQDKYFTDPEEHTYDWSGIHPRDEYITNVLEDVESALKESTAKWKFVVGHHTIKSASHHGETKELVKQLLPILEANNVDLYINGHDHCLQRVTTSESPIQFLTSGGGSKAWRGDINEALEGLNFFHDGQGFMSVHLTQSDAEIVFYDVFGKVLHRFNIHKQQEEHYSAI